MSEKPMPQRMKRREFLRFMAMTASSIVVASCAGEAPQTTAPTTPAATAPTPAAAPAAAATAAPAAPTAAAAAPAAPTAAAATEPAANLVGELQGPTIITDPSKIPTSFKEAPLLADMVKASKLPPVQERV